MQVCEALADPTRVAIVEMLSRRDHTAGEIAEKFRVSRPAISRHLRVLREAGLANVEPDAQRRVYRIDPTPLRDLESWLDRQRAFWERRLDALGKHLDHMEAKQRAAKGRKR